MAEQLANPTGDTAGVYVVIAAYNEASCIAEVAGEVRAAYPNVIVVDDGSSDDTFAAAQRGARFVLRHVINRGQGASLQTGIDFALSRGAKYIVTFDADGQHRVEDIERLLAPLLAGTADIALGSRFLGRTTGMPASRRFVLKCAVLFTRLVNRMRLTDAHNGLRAFTRKAAGFVQIKADRMAHASEMIDFIRTSGLTYTEVPVEIRYTEYSLSKGQSSGNAFRIVFHYLMGRIFE
ncbi:MAG: glycosyltransferase family 2 protein [Phycisphaerales bacterium]|nr:glycosyltransferase family 2 protein [Phycisphaerales bacterium]